MSQLILPNKFNFTAADLADSLRRQVIMQFADPTKRIIDSDSNGIATKFNHVGREILFHFVTREKAEIKIGFSIKEFELDPINSVAIFSETIKQGVEAFLKLKQEKTRIVLQPSSQESKDAANVH